MSAITPGGALPPHNPQLNVQHAEAPPGRTYSRSARALRLIAHPFIAFATCGNRSLLNRNWTIVREGRIPMSMVAPIMQHVAVEMPPSAPVHGLAAPLLQPPTYGGGVLLPPPPPTTYGLDFHHSLTHSVLAFQAPPPPSELEYSSLSDVDRVSSLVDSIPIQDHTESLKVLTSYASIHFTTEGFPLIMSHDGVKYNIHSRKEAGSDYCLVIQNSEDPTQVIELRFNSERALTSVSVNGEIRDKKELSDPSNLLSKMITAFSKDLLLSERNIGVQSDGKFHVHPLAIKRYPDVILRMIVEYACLAPPIVFLQDDLSKGAGVDYGGLSKEFVTELAKALMDQQVIIVDTEGMPVLKSSDPPLRREVYAHLGGLLSASEARPYPIGRIFPDKFFGVLKAIGSNSTASDENLSIVTARQIAEHDPETAKFLLPIITAALTGELSPLARDHLSLAGFEATQQEAKEFLMERYADNIRAGKAIYEGISPNLSTKLIDSPVVECSEKIQGLPLSPKSIIGCFEVAPGLHPVILEKIEFLKEIIYEKFAAGDLAWIKKFLFCVTAQNVILASTKIKFWRSDTLFCSSHTCFSSLEIPTTHSTDDSQTTGVIEDRVALKKRFLENLNITMNYQGYSFT